MPIIWKAQFTFPFIGKMLAGQVKDPISFARTIASTYDSCIKTGFPLPPAPPVPFTTGKTPLLAAAIFVGFSLKVFQMMIKGFQFNMLSFNKMFGKINEQITEDASVLFAELNANLKSYDKNVKDVIDSLDTSTSDLQIDFAVNSLPENSQGYAVSNSAGQYATIEVGDPCIKKYIIPLQNVGATTFASWQNGGALNSNGNLNESASKSIKQSIQSTFKENSKMINNFQKSYKDSLELQTEIVDEKRKSIIDLSKAFAAVIPAILSKKPTIFAVILALPLLLKRVIKTFTSPITAATEKIKELTTKLNEVRDKAEQVKMIKDLIKLENLKLLAAIKSLAEIPKIIVNIFKINPFKLLNFKAPDLSKLKTAANKRLSEQMNGLVNEINDLQNNKNNLYKDLSAIQEAADTLNEAISEAFLNNSTLSDDSTSQAQITSAIQTELEKIFPCTCITYEDRQKLLSINDFSTNEKDLAGIGIKAKSLVGQISSKGKGELASVNLKIEKLNLRLDNLKETRKNVNNIEIDSQKNKISNLFDIALGVGLMAYWIGGVIPSAGIATVILPGLPPVVLGLKTDFSNPIKFFTSLELIFQVHALTIVGVFVPPPPAPPLPWVGYF
tara:strand:+ start:624 stop:2468 length:1845 start_codon:yes stop_codon:yes gene_type:complete